MAGYFGRGPGELPTSGCCPLPCGEALWSGDCCLVALLEAFTSVSSWWRKPLHPFSWGCCPSSSGNVAGGSQGWRVPRGYWALEFYLNIRGLKPNPGNLTALGSLPHFHSCMTSGAALTSSACKMGPGCTCGEGWSAVRTQEGSG